MAGDEPGAGRFLEFAGGIRELSGFRWVDISDGAPVAKPSAALRLQTIEADCSLPGA
jgi:hypothetical protein